MINEITIQLTESTISALNAIRDTHPALSYEQIFTTSLTKYAASLQNNAGDSETPKEKSNELNPETRDLIEELLISKDSFEDTCIAMGDYYASTKDTVRALTWYKKVALPDYNSYAASCLKIGKLYFMDSPDEAIIWLKKLIGDLFITNRGRLVGI